MTTLNFFNYPATHSVSKYHCFNNITVMPTFNLRFNELYTIY